MQFKIATVLVVTCLAAIILAAFWFTPFMAAVYIAIALMLITPSIWITGIVFARGLLRGFFIGGTSAGCIAHVTALNYLYPDNLYPLLPDDLGSNECRATILAIWSAPGILALIGGGLGSLTQWALIQPKSKVEAELPKDNNLTSDARSDNPVSSASTGHPLS